MYTLQAQEDEVDLLLTRFLQEHQEVRGSAQRYDSDIDDAFASFPHIDLYLWYPYVSPDHDGRPTYTEQQVTRLAKLTANELAVLVKFAQSLTAQILNTEVVLSRFDAGRCAFVLYRSNT